MISLLLFSRANEESETKSQRTLGNVETLVERHKNGLPVNIKSVGRHPFWIDDSGSQYEAVKNILLIGILHVKRLICSCPAVVYTV